MAIVMVTSALMTNVAVRFEDDEYLLPGRRIFQAHRWLAISNELGRGLAHRARFDAGGNASEHGERLSGLAAWCLNGLVP